MDRTVSLLIISPYKQLSEMIKEIVAVRSDITADIYVGNLEEALAITRNLDLSCYDGIVSRGGTALQLKKNTQLPVYDIGLSGMDVLRSLRLAQGFNDKIAVVGFETITNPAKKVCEILQYNTPIYTVTSGDESFQCLESLKSEGVNVVVCDVITAHHAILFNMNPILITSGYDTIQNTLDEAVYYSLITKDDRLKKNTLFKLQQKNPYPCMVFDDKGDIFFSSFSDKQDYINLYLQAHYDELKMMNESSFERIIKNKLVIISVKHNNNYMFVYARISDNVNLRRINAIHIISSEHIENTQDEYYCSHTIGSTINILKKYSDTSASIIIRGEVGTGKDKAALMLHRQGKYSKNLFYQIDCANMTNKDWGYLLRHHDSPLSHNKRTIYFKNINSIDNSIFIKLLATIIDTNLNVRNQLIFSVISTKSAEEDDNKYISELLDNISCVSIYLPSLKERSEDIPILTSFYINRLNLSLGKQIIGFEPKALQVLTKFPWERNLSQLQRIVRELMLLTDTSYISYENTMTILHKETAVWNDATTGYGGNLDLNQTLSKITYDVIRLVLKEEHNNHTNTAYRLGISRSTLWRILKAHQTED